MDKLCTAPSSVSIPRLLPACCAADSHALDGRMRRSHASPAQLLWHPDHLKRTACPNPSWNVDSARTTTVGHVIGTETGCVSSSLRLTSAVPQAPQQGAVPTSKLQKGHLPHRTVAVAHFLRHSGTLKAPNSQLASFRFTSHRVLTSSRQGASNSEELSGLCRNKRGSQILTLQSNYPYRQPTTGPASTWPHCGPSHRRFSQSHHGKTPLNALGGETTGSEPKGPSTAQILSRKILRKLSSLPLAIQLLFTISGACALGTVIEQGAAPAVYLRDYPSDHPVLGFLTGDLILLLGLDHVYTNPVFLGLLLLFGACLSACTSTRQLPMLKVAQRWSFVQSVPSLGALQFSESLPSARLADMAVELQRRGYEVFQQGRSLYGFKGLAGRLAPIGVHAAMILVMVGGTCSALGGFRGNVMLPQGLDVAVPDVLVGNTFAARPTTSMNMILQLDGFSITYRPNGEVKQFYSDLRVLDYTGRELTQKTISVNDPLRCQGVTVYQTDWAISAVQLRVDGQDPIKLPVATLPDPNGSDAKLFGTFLPLPGQDGTSDRPQGITLLARDLQSVVLYDSQGKFVGVRRPGSKKPIAVEGVNIVIEDIIGSSGMELKMDPGVPIVYAGFGALILTSFISYLSHSQVWAFQDGSTVHFGGKTNRAKYQFREELNEIAGAIPEVSGLHDDSSMEPSKEEVKAV